MHKCFLLTHKMKLLGHLVKLYVLALASAAGKLELSGVNGRGVAKEEGCLVRVGVPVCIRASGRGLRLSLRLCHRLLLRARPQLPQSTLNPSQSAPVHTEGWLRSPGGALTVTTCGNGVDGAVQSCRSNWDCALGFACELGRCCPVGPLPTSASCLHKSTGGRGGHLSGLLWEVPNAELPVLPRPEGLRLVSS